MAKGGDLRAAGGEPNGAAAVIQHYLNTTWLWNKVRVQGGAYGGSCALDRHAGLFTFTSYRDPNLLETLDVYDRTGAFLRETEVSEAELHEEHHRRHRPDRRLPAARRQGPDLDAALARP